MRRSALLLSIVFLLPAWTSMAAVVDGDLSEWGPETLMGTDANGISMYLDWDAENLYFAWDGSDLGSETDGADLFVYLNTSEGGSVTAKDWNGVRTIPFAADYGIVIEDSSYSAVVGFQDGIWQDVSVPENYSGWSGNMVTELSIPLSDIGSPSDLDIIVWD